jgi:hypothetical protein
MDCLAVAESYISRMPTCFVIQPFDGGPYDDRYKETIKPAIINAGLEPYRVDEDKGVAIPIDAIEEGIRAAVACVADITLDNPNVWYELGYALALQRPVIMICGSDRVKFPFDIQHRNIYRYKTTAARDFVALQSEITERLQKRLMGDAVLDSVSQSDELAPVEGLSQMELAVIAAIISNIPSDKGYATLYRIRIDVERKGFTSAAFLLGMRRLGTKGFIKRDVLEDTSDPLSSPEDSACITEKGWEWIDRNQAVFSFRKEAEEPPPSSTMP